MNNILIGNNNPFNQLIILSLENPHGVEITGVPVAKASNITRPPGSKAECIIMTLHLDKMVANPSDVDNPTNKFYARFRIS